MCGFDIKIGASFASVLERKIISPIEVEFLLKFFEDKNYLIIIDIKERTISIILKQDIESIEILEAYFYACMCGLYISMARSIPIVSINNFFYMFWCFQKFITIVLFFQDLLLKSETFELSYPLLNMYIIYEKFANLKRNVQLSIAIQSVCAMDLIIRNEYRSFVTNLKINGIRTDFINISTNINAYICAYLKTPIIVLGWITATNLLPVGAWRFSTTINK